MSDRTQIFPGLLGGAADTRRSEFDAKNAVILNNDVPVDIVFAGDSITHAWELNAFFRSYGLVLNRGISGDITENLRQRFEADVIQLRPRVCVMLIGVNSLGKLDIDPPYTAEQMAAFFEEHYRPMLDMAKAAGQKMILCSVTPLRGSLIFSNTEDRNRAIVKMNEVIRRTADEYGFAFVDYHKAFVDEDGLTMRDGLSGDGLHPNYLGYNKMAGLLYPVLDELLK